MRWKKKQIKQEFIKLYEAPEPPGKQEFLKQFDTCYLSMGQFMWQQLLYIKKWMWLFSAGIFFLGTMLGRNLDRETVWVISALIPFLALTFLTESGRSKIYGMEELEYATRFSLKSLMLARLGVLGLFHGVILLLLFLCILYICTAIFSIFSTNLQSHLNLRVKTRQIMTAVWFVSCRYLQPVRLGAIQFLLYNIFNTYYTG